MESRATSLVALQDSRRTTLKKITALFFLVLLLLTGRSAVAETFLYESIIVGTQTVSSTAIVAIDNAAYPNIVGIYTVETGNLRFRTDGTAPTATEGHLLYIGDVLVVEGLTDIRNFKAISTTSGTSTLRISYKRK